MQTGHWVYPVAFPFPSLESGRLNALRLDLDRTACRLLESIVIVLFTTYTFRVARSPVSGISKTDTFEVSLEDRMTILDALFKIQRDIDASLSFRCSCRVGMCGTCAMYID